MIAAFLLTNSVVTSLATSQPPGSALRAPAAQCEAENCEPGAEAQECGPLARARQGEPSGDARAEADDQPRRQLRTLALEKGFDPFPNGVETRLPKAPSTLWKRRLPYVRGARPLHCTITEEESALERKQFVTS